MITNRSSLGDKKIENSPCHQIFDRLIILNNGEVPLCCEDTPSGKHIMGNVEKSSPIDIFNGPQFNRMRNLHSKGQKNTIPLCKECTMLYSEDRMKVF